MLNPHPVIVVRHTITYAPGVVQGLIKHYSMKNFTRFFLSLFWLGNLLLFSISSCDLVEAGDDDVNGNEDDYVEVEHVDLMEQNDPRIIAE